jgi:hypothetical protein
MLIEAPPIHDVTDDKNEAAQKTFLGKYMPFAGVHYYRILDEREVHAGKAKIGFTGWHVTEPWKEPIA